MGLLDYCLFVVVGYCLVRGLFRGLVKELASIIGVLGGLYAAFVYHPLVANALSPWIPHRTVLNMISCFLLFIGVCLLVSLVAALINYLMNISLLNWLNRTGGAFFGAVKGAAVAVVLVFMLTAFLPKNTAILRQSLVAHYVIRASSSVVRVVSREFQFVSTSKTRELKKKWNQPNT